MDTRPPEQVADPEQQAKVRKAGLVMLGVFLIFTLLFFCGGLAGVGVAASGSERDGVTAMYVVTGPAMFALMGLLASVIGHFAIKNSLGAKIAVPIVVGIAAGPCSLGCLAFFFEAIWPSL